MLGHDATDTASQKEKRIVPLFQVEYDRTLCQPLGTLTEFNKVKLNLKKRPAIRPAAPKIVDSDSSSNPSPISFAGSPNCEEEDDIILLQPKVVGEPPPAKPKPHKQPESRGNALVIFEFSTVYPFVYGNNKYKCFVCSQPFLDATLMRRHMDESHTLPPLRRLINNRNANVLKVDVSEIMCKICSARPESFHDLKVHLKEVHQKSISPDLQDNLIPFKLANHDSNMFTCVICHESFIKFRPLVIHMSVHFSNYSCEVCGSGFMTLRLLKKHLEVHENGNFPCDKCDKVFNTTHKRSLHVRGVHLKHYPRRCPICPERFNSNYRRTIHLQDVHNHSTRVHKCETCGRGFNLKYHLLCHVRSVHLQERNQQCDVCHHRFCNKETLKRHMITHTGEKNYKCEFCGMAFLRRKNLKDHLRLHEVTLPCGT